MLQKVYSHIARDKWEYIILEVHAVSGSPCREIADVLTFYCVRFVEKCEILRKRHSQREPQEWRTVEVVISDKDLTEWLWMQTAHRSVQYK